MEKTPSDQPASDNAASKSLHSTKERLRAILDTAADAIISVDYKGIITDVNPATERMFGYSQDELVGQNIKMLMPQPYQDEHDGYIARYLETKEPRIIGIGREVLGKRKDGKVFPIDLAVSEVDHIGVFTGIVRDISERVEIREKLVQSERLAAIGEAMAGLAHESRNALQRSQACLDVLESELRDRPESLELLTTIQLAQDQLHRLYEEVRAYAAPIHLLPQDCDVGEIVQTAWCDVTALQKERDIRLEINGQSDDLRCEVDPFALGQVFRNIFENAVHASDDPVKISVAFEEVEPTDVDAPMLAISVCDNGPGISPEHAGQIFHSFFTTKTSGTGLGLAIAQRIVRAHHGQIELIPNREQGAEFVVRLPRKQS